MSTIGVAGSSLGSCQKSGASIGVFKAWSSYEGSSEYTDWFEEYTGRKPSNLQVLMGFVDLGVLIPDLELQVGGADHDFDVEFGLIVWLLKLIPIVCQIGKCGVHGGRLVSVPFPILRFQFGAMQEVSQL